MDRSYASGSSGSAPIAPASPSVGYPTAGNPGTGTPATKPGPYWYHQITEELLAIIFSAGITPAQGTLTQLASAIQSGKLFSSPASGTSDAITAGFVPAVASLINGMSLYVRAGSVNTTTTPTFTPASGTIAAKTIVKGAGAALAAGDIAGGGHWIELQYDATLDKWVLLNPATGVAITSSLPEVPTRQTVLGGPVDTSGLPSFLSATSANLSLTSQNIASGAPLVVAAANGFNSTGALDRVGISTANLTWSSLATNATNYLYVDVAANGTMTPGSTTLAPAYQFGGTRSTSNGQAIYNIQEASMTIGNGSSVAQTCRTFIGEAVTNASTVISTIAYAYQGRYDSGLFAVSGSTSYARSHNLGVSSYDLVVHFADDAAGTSERQSMPYTYTSSQIGWYAQTSSRILVTVATAPSVGHNQSGGAVVTGYYRIRANRGW